MPGLSSPLGCCRPAAGFGPAAPGSERLVGLSLGQVPEGRGTDEPVVFLSDLLTFVLLLGSRAGPAQDFTRPSFFCR